MDSRPAWVRELDPSRLKSRLFGSTVAISGIQVLRAFMALSTGDGRGTDEARTTLAWLAGGHFVLVVSALLLALTERWAPSKAMARKT